MSTVIYGSQKKTKLDGPEVTSPMMDPISAMVQFLSIPLQVGGQLGRQIEDMAQGRYNVRVREHTEWGYVKPTTSSSELKKMNIFGE